MPRCGSLPVRWPTRHREPRSSTPERKPEWRGQVTARSRRHRCGRHDRWNETVGEAVAKHVQPVKLDGGKLVVEVDDPAWATQLKFLEANLRERLLESTGARIDSFEVRVRRTR